MLCVSCDAKTGSRGTESGQCTDTLHVFLLVNESRFLPRDCNAVFLHKSLSLSGDIFTAHY